MSLLSFIALVFAVLGVWLTIKQTIWCWPVSLVAVVISIVVFYEERLFGDMSLQVFYFFAGIYGWVYWEEHRKRDFKVENMKLSWVPVLIIATALQSILYYYLLLYFKGDKPFLDAVLTAASLTTTYMMTRKWVENWITWVIIDLIYVLLYLLKDMYLFAILNFLMAAVAFYGWLKWKKEVYAK
jgi:nicotinamide mononucleotide transporter